MALVQAAVAGSDNPALCHFVSTAGFYNQVCGQGGASGLGMRCGGGSLPAPPSPHLRPWVAACTRPAQTTWRASPRRWPPPCDRCCSRANMAASDARQLATGMRPPCSSPLSQFPAPRGEVVELKQRSTWSRVGVLESQLPVRIVELCGANATVSSPPCEGCVPLVVHKRCVSSITGMSCRRSSPLE